MAERTTRSLTPRDRDVIRMLLLPLAGDSTYPEYRKKRDELSVRLRLTPVQIGVTVRHMVEQKKATLLH